MTRTGIAQNCPRMRSSLQRKGSIMRAAIFNGPRSITVGERPDPVIQNPTDAIVRVVLASGSVLLLAACGHVNT